MIKYKFEAYTVAFAIIVVAGLLKFYIYYKFFFISILPFLDADEIIISSFDNLLTFILIFSIPTLLSYQSAQNVDYKLFASSNFFIKIKFYQYFNIYKGGFYIILAALAIIITKLRNPINSYEFYLWLPLLAWAIYLTPLLIFKSYKFCSKHKISIDKLSILLLFSSINLIVFAICSGFNEAYKVKCEFYYLNSEFTLSTNEIIKSTDTNYFIGKTKQFVFIYNSISKKTTIIPMQNISKITFKK